MLSMAFLLTILSFQDYYFLFLNHYIGPCLYNIEKSNIVLQVVLYIIWYKLIDVRYFKSKVHFLYVHRNLIILSSAPWFAYKYLLFTFLINCLIFI